MFTPTRHRLTALLIMIVAAFAGSIPFWGPTMNLGFGDTQAYQWTTQNWTLYVAPAAAAFLGGLFLLLPRFARVAKFGAWLALGGGLWLLFGPLLSEFFLADGVTLSTDATLASLLYHLIPGFLLTALAGYGIGISTWARRWHLHRDRTVEGAREHARRETERETVRRETTDEERRTAAAGTARTDETRGRTDETRERRETVASNGDDGDGDGRRRRSSETEHTAVDHRDRERV